jgi:hypothetical protein
MYYLYMQFAYQALSNTFCQKSNILLINLRCFALVKKKFEVFCLKSNM